MKITATDQGRRDLDLELTIAIPPHTDRVALLGVTDCNIKIIREALGVTITVRDDVAKIIGEGDAVNRAARVFAELTEAVTNGHELTREEVIEHLHRLILPHDETGALGPGDALEVYAGKRRVMPKTDGQRLYIQAIREMDMVFCTGPAGTGKTYLAVATAVAMLKRGTARRLVLARPAVEAGEKLGFLPGDLQEKVNPYLRPLLDALYDMMPFEYIENFMHGDLIEVIPLAFMRGRTLNDAVVILDEAQNTTKSQMLMFLTRMGNGSKIIVTGDTSQIDLEVPEESGLIDAEVRLRDIPGIGFVKLDKLDIVRHKLVTRIVQAYGNDT